MIGKHIDGVSLYFHIPFCTRKCPYCHFYVLPDSESLKNEWFKALKIEWERGAHLLKGKPLTSLYFGGGTPSLLAPSILGAILEWTNVSPSCEITLEANPENVSYALMREMAAIGINRVSLGVQSLDDSSLVTLERRHSAKTALAACEDTLKAGITNLSIDLMTDLPDQTLASLENTLHRLESIPLTHLSLYNLTLEPHTAFFKRKSTLTPRLPSPETSLQLLQQAVFQLERLGLTRYEVSAFAKPHFYSRHNTGYWIGRPFLGFGPSAFSYWDKKRFRNVASLSRYAKLLSQNHSPVDFEEQLSYPDDLHELLAIQLRLIEGVDLSFFQARHGLLPSSTLETLNTLISEGFLEQKESALRLTQQGLLFYDSVAETLI